MMRTPMLLAALGLTMALTAFAADVKGLTRAADVEVRTAPPGTASVKVLARGTNAFLAELSMAPGAKVPVHRDATEEIIYVRSGGGTMTMDGVSFPLAAGDSIVMPPDAEVSFVNGDAPTVVVQVFAGPEPAVKYEAWAVE